MTCLAEFHSLLKAKTTNPDNNSSRSTLIHRKRFSSKHFLNVTELFWLKWLRDWVTLIFRTHTHRGDVCKSRAKVVLLSQPWLTRRHAVILWRWGNVCFLWTDYHQQTPEWYYLSKSFIAFLVPAVEVFSGVEDKGLTSFYVSEVTICRRKWKKDNHMCQWGRLLKLCWEWRRWITTGDRMEAKQALFVKSPPPFFPSCWNFCVGKKEWSIFLSSVDLSLEQRVEKGVWKVSSTFVMVRGGLARVGPRKCSLSFWHGCLVSSQSSLDTPVHSRQDDQVSS